VFGGIVGTVSCDRRDWP